MKLEHSFVLPVDVDTAWHRLLDIEQVAPCLPGAALDSVHGDEFTGHVKVKLGPITVAYRGTARFVEKDEANHRVVLTAAGREQRGSGTASATVHATLTAESPTTTKVDVTTELDVTGRPAQFGRSVLADVSDRLLGQFAARLAETLSSADGEQTTEPEPERKTEPNGARKPAGPARPLGAVAGTANIQAQPINLLELAGPILLRAAAPVLTAVGTFILIRWFRSRRGASA